MSQRAVFLVLARLKLLVGVFFNLLFLHSNVELQPFAVGFDLFDAGPGGFELHLGGRGFAVVGFAFGTDLGEFLLNAVNFAVAVL